jgi:hypothetical membrane protein
MRIGFSSSLELRLVFADPRQTPPDRTQARRHLAAVLAASPLQLALLFLTVLLTGIGISIASTTDPQWWHLHFSRLGTFHNSSGATFNTTLIVSGILVALMARAVGRELRRVERHRVRRGTARVARILYTAVGVNLTLVGCVPLNVNQFVHDHVAAGMVLSFAVLLLVSPIMMHRMPRHLLATTALVFVWLAVGVWLFVTATINLALFEVIGFSAMFAWSGVFMICLARAACALAATSVAAPDAPTLPVAAASTDASDGVADAPSTVVPVSDAVAGRVTTARGAAAHAGSPDVARRRPRRATRTLRPASRRASRRDARVLPRRRYTESAGRAASGR